MTTPLWIPDHRPGYFGRRRAEKTAALDQRFGEGNWKLAHVAESGIPGVPPVMLDYVAACMHFYEQSYFLYLKDRPEDLDFICAYKECYDNALSNIESGTDYAHQHDSGSYSNHIQDIAVRNVLARLGRRFTGSNGKYLQIRSADSDGYRFGPGNVPFWDPARITQPSLCPTWAKKGSVEDFWQSNKWVLRRSA